MPTLHIHRQSAYLIGRDRKVRLGLNVLIMISVILRFATSPLTTPAAASNTRLSSTGWSARRSRTELRATGEFFSTKKFVIYVFLQGSPLHY